MLTHLPIGMLFFSLAVTLLPAHARERLGPALSLSLLLSAASAAAACLTGYLLSRSGDYDAGIVSRHQWLGIATALVTTAALLLPAWRRPLVWSAFPLLAIGAHFGAVLTHGEGYLFPAPAAIGSDTAWSGADTLQGAAAATAAVGATPDTARQAQRSADSQRVVHVYRDRVAPILRSSCYGCHSAVKQKGGLRLDGEAFIRRGGRDGRVLVPGDAAGSSLYANLLLPLEDERHMPPKGRRQLTRAEILTIRDWVAAGASFTPAIVAAAAADTEDLPSDGEPSAKDVVAPAVDPPPMKSAPARRIPLADEPSLRLLESAGAVIDRRMPEANGLSVNLVNVREPDAALLSALSAVREQVTELRLSGPAFGDAFLGALPGMSNLHRLHLGRTGISDAASQALRRFPSLEVLNLYGTAMGDASLEALADMAQLRRLYLWRTRMSAEGVSAFRKRRPDVDVDAGELVLKVPDTAK